MKIFSYDRGHSFETHTVRTSYLKIDTSYIKDDTIQLSRKGNK